MRKLPLILLSCLTALLIGGCGVSDIPSTVSSETTDHTTASVQMESAADETVAVVEAATADETAAVTTDETMLVLHSDAEDAAPFYFEAQLGKTEFAYGEPITFEVLLKNVGKDHPYNGDATHFRADASLFYVDETGAVVILQEMHEVTTDNTPNIAKSGKESVYTYQFFGADPENRTPPSGTYGILLNYSGYSVEFFDVITVIGEQS